MNQREHYNFLQKIASDIHKLTVSAKAKAKYHARMKKFEKMRLDWEAAMNKATKDADADPRLRNWPIDYWPNRQAGPPKIGNIWDDDLKSWRPEDFPPDPIAWFWNRDFSPEQRDLTLDEILTCDYFRLAVIHDGALQGQRHIYFRCTEGDVWTDDTGASGPIPSEARLLWEEISEWGQDKETFWFPGLRVLIENALSDVRANLLDGGVNPQKTTSRKSKRKKKTPHKLLIQAREQKARELLKSNDCMTTEQLGKELGCSKVTASRTDAWRKHQARKKQVRKLPNGFKRDRRIDGPDTEAIANGAQAEHLDIKEMVEDYNAGRSSVIPNTEAIATKLSLDNEDQAERLFKETLHFFPNLTLNISD